MDPVPTIVDNVRRLMAAREWTQVDLAKRAKVGQNTISRLLDYQKLRRVPSVATVAALADAFGIASWQLQIPGLPVDLLDNRRVSALVENYAAAEPAGRENLERVAEGEARLAQGALSHAARARA